jgi:hypothetical protein
MYSIVHDIILFDVGGFIIAVETQHITIHKPTADTIKELKIYPKESYNDVIVRLIEFYKNNNDND